MATNSTTQYEEARKKSCDNCASALAPALADVRDPQSGERFAILRCPACGLGHTVPAPANIGEYYGEPYYGQRHSFTARYCAEYRVRILERATGRRRGALLDIGCGDGTFLEAARRRGYRVVGSEMGGAADRAAAAGIDVRALDELEDLAPFDVVTMWHTLEHFPSPNEIVGRVSSLLGDEGVFIVAVPNSQGLQARFFGGDWFHFDVPRHLFHFGRRSLSSLLERHHFAVECWLHQELEYDVFGWMQSALNAVLPVPNVLFQSLTGKRVSGTSELAASYALGSLIAPAAFAASMLSGRRATLIAIAKRGRRGERQAGAGSNPPEEKRA